jgi:2-C-methyl-D-erythritol 4-phosphate cytidylyltransferase|tara:strand:- start:319 stop:960 length:642 start_codon:yes stop_codon:yes gene_type:complete
MNIGIILAAGSSNRYKGNIPKQFQLFEKKMIVEYSINTFYNHSGIHEVILVVPKKYFDFANQNIKNCRILVGGKTRQESSFIALNACPSKTKNVLIHDAARPFVDNKIITECLENLKKNKAVCPALASTDTVAKVKGNKVEKILDRSRLFRLQTPQAFNYKILFESYKKINKKVTDDISVVKQQGYIAKIIMGNQKNMKITYEQDLEIIKTLL